MGLHRGDNLSFHSPIWVKLRVGALPIRNKIQPANTKKPSWSRASVDHVYTFTASLQERLQALSVPPGVHCEDVHCSDKSHCSDTDTLVLDILCAIVETSYTTLPMYGCHTGRLGGRDRVPGWSEEVGPYQGEAKYWHDACRY